MKGPATVISVRLDDEAAAALRLLESTGRSRSEAVRHAIVLAAHEARTRRALAAEAAEVASDAEDAAESARVLDLMEDLRAPW